MVSIKALALLAVASFVAAAPAPVANIEERFLGLKLPTFSGNNMEYSLHSSKTNKHLGSCHIYLQDDKEIAYPADPSYNCDKTTRFCKAVGPGAKQVSCLVPSTNVECEKRVHCSRLS